MKHRDILEKLSVLKPEQCIHKKFDFAVYNNEDDIKATSSIPFCGTIGCLAGELPGLTKDWYFNTKGKLKCKFFNNDLSVTENLSTYFNINEIIIISLFCPSPPTDFDDLSNVSEFLKGAKTLYSDATLEEVQANLKIFLKNTI